MTLLLFIIVGFMFLAWYTVYMRGKKQFRTVSFVCFVLVLAASIMSYLCFIHYSHSNNDKYYKNTDSYVLELKGMEFSNGRNLLICSNGGDNSLWTDNAGELLLSNRNNGYHLHSNNFDLPLYISDDKDSLLFNVVNLSNELTINNGDELTIRHQGNNEPIFYLKYSIQDSILFIFKDAVSETPDTLRMAKFRIGANLYNLLSQETSQHLPKDILGGCYLMRDHFTIDTRINKRPDKAVHLFCNRQIRNNSSLLFYINDIQANPMPSETTHPIEGKWFYYGIGSNANRIMTVKNNSSVVNLAYRTPLRYVFPKDTSSYRSRMFLTTDLQEIIDRQDNFDFFYRFLPQQKSGNLFSASGIITFQRGNANWNPDLQVVDLADGIDAKTLKINAGQDFQLKSSASCSGQSDVADVKYILNVHDFRTDNIVYNKAWKLYAVLLLLLFIIYLLNIWRFPKKVEDEKIQFYSRRMLIETLVYLTLIAFLSVRLIMLWRLHAFPPIENVSGYEINRLTDPNNFIWTFRAIVILLLFRVFLFFLPDKKIRIKPVIFIILYLIILLSILFLGKKIVILRSFIAIFIYCLTNSLLISKKPRKWLLYLFANIVLFFLVLLHIEKGLILPCAGMTAIMLALSLPAQKRRRQLLWIGAGFVLAIVFCHLLFAKRIAPAVGLLSHQMEARMQAMVYEPDELFSDPKVEFDGEYTQEILNATSNYWYIGNHINYRKEYLKKEHKRFMPVQEYTQKGVSYITQTRDLSVQRYLNFEHGPLPIVLICFITALLLCLIFWHTRLKKEDNEPELPSTAWLPTLIALFLTVYTIYLALVNYNMAVFVGLDFPFLTLTSNTSVISFIAFLGTILWSICRKKPELCISKENSGNPIGQNEKNPIIIISILACLCAGGYVIYQTKAVQATPDYSVSMQPLADFLSKHLNKELKNYQEQHPRAFRRSNREDNMRQMHAVIDSLINDERFISNCDSSIIPSMPFIKSVLKKSNYSDEKDLIYARRSSGQYILASNATFNRLTPIFKKQKTTQWQGDIMAANIPKSRLIYIDGREYRIENELFDNLGTHSLYEKALWNIPARYCYDGQNKIMFIRDNGTYSQYEIYPQGIATEKLEDRYSCLILTKDLIRIGDRTIKVGIEGGHYLSKRIHYNGHRQVIYPLGNEFVLAANLDRLLVNHYPKQSNEKPFGFKSEDQTVHISIDYNLQHETMNYLRNNNSCQRGDGISVVAIDGNGCVRLLGDHNPNNTPVDPNDVEKIDSIRSITILNGDRTSERDALANRNIITLSKGPGSTIKPVFYCAIASKANLGWNNLILHQHNIPGCVWNSIGQYDLSRISNDRIKQEPSSENLTEDMDVSTFIKTSNNFFFGSLLLLGTFPPQALVQPNNTLSVGTEPFPSFRINNNWYNLRDASIPGLYANRETLRGATLEKGLKDNFLYRIHEENTNNYRNIQRQKYVINMLDFLNIDYSDDYVIPEKTHFMRKEYYTGNELDILTEHLNITHGGYPLQTSPLLMAEAYLRIVLGNRSDKLLTYNDQVTTHAEQSFITEGYEPNIYRRTLRTTLFQGLWNVIQERGGTLYRQGTLRQLQNTLEQQGIFLYGKTGTCNRDRNHHYAFILSNQRLHGDGELNPSNLKVYVIYFGYYGTIGYTHSNTQPITRDILLQIINSETFRNYWNQQ